jgi:hypothetical protein
VPIVDYQIINLGKTPAIVQAVSADFIKSAALADIKYKEEAIPGEIVIAAGESFPPASDGRYAIITYSGPSRIITGSANLPKVILLARRQMSRLTEQSPEN